MDDSKSNTVRAIIAADAYLTTRSQKKSLKSSCPVAKITEVDGKIPAPAFLRPYLFFSPS
jgi:hypothetical protein